MAWSPNIFRYTDIAHIAISNAWVFRHVFGADVVTCVSSHSLINYLLSWVVIHFVSGKLIWAIRGHTYGSFTSSFSTLGVGVRVHILDVIYTKRGRIEQLLIPLLDQEHDFADHHSTPIPYAIHDASFQSWPGTSISLIYRSGQGNIHRCIPTDFSVPVWNHALRSTSGWMTLSQRCPPVSGWSSRHEVYQCLDDCFKVSGHISAHVCRQRVVRNIQNSMFTRRIVSMVEITFVRWMKYMHKLLT